MRRATLLVALVAGIGACRGTSSTDGTPSTRESPQASAQPALLAVATAPANPSGGPAPASIRGDEVLAPDTPAREPIGFTLSAVLRLADLTGPVRAPEVNAAGIEAARKATDLRLAIDFSPTRIRATLLGQGFVLPPETEIRARSDRYGHIVVWPGAASYRPLAPGTMRALLGERRFDVAPISPAAIELKGEGRRHISLRTRKADVTTRAASALFEIAKVEGAGEGGVLLCRTLLDLMNAPPSTSLCGVDELPAWVELRWTNRGSLVFELTGLLKKTDVPPAALLVPPSTAAFAAAAFPVAGVSPMLSPQELTALRSNDVEVPGSAEALVVANPSVELRVLFLDGVPVAWVAPGARGELRGLRRGRYVAQWRTFLGDAIEPAMTQIVPGTALLGGAFDAGKP